MFWLLMTLALAEDERTQPIEVKGWTDDGSVAVLQKWEAWEYEGSIASRTFVQVYTFLPNGDAFAGETCFNLEGTEEPICGSKEDWADFQKTLHPGRTSQRCGASSAFAEAVDTVGYPGESISGEWDGDSFAVSRAYGSHGGKGLVRVGVERGGRRWEQEVMPYEGSGAWWRGNLVYTPHWSPSCAYMAWVRVDQTPAMSRDGYGSELYEGQVLLHPAGPRVMAAGSDPDKLRTELVKAGWGVVQWSSEVSMEPGVYAWSRARDAVEKLTRVTKTETVLPLPAGVSSQADGEIDVVVQAP